MTSQKRTQDAADIPVALSVVSSDTVKLGGLRDMKDVQQLVPSLFVQQGSSSNSARFGIRGISTGGENINLESSVGLYVDEIYRPRQGAMINNLLDLQRIEVLRGPQGTLFGRNTPAGAVLFSSAKPDFDSGFVSVAAGDYDRRNIEGALSLSQSDTLAWRFSGFMEQRDGYVSDVNAGSDYFDDRDRWGTRVQALYTPEPDLSVRVIADWSELEEACCAAGSWKNNLRSDAAAPGEPPRVGTDARVLANGGVVVPDSDFYDYRTALSTPSRSRNEDGGLSLHISWQWERLQLTSITAARHFELDDFGDADFGDLAVVDGGVAVEDTQYSQEFRASGSGSRLQWLAGLYWYKLESRADSRLLLGDDIADFTGTPPEALPAGSGAFSDVRQDTDSVALFGQSDIAVTDTVTFTTGMRWTHEEKKLRNVFTENASPSLDFTTPGWGFWLLDPLTPRENLHENIDDDQLTGTLKLAWSPGDHSLLYASWGTGYKSGGVNIDRLEPTIDPVFDAETSETSEIGAKLSWPSRGVRLALAAHHTEIDDLQVRSLEGTSFTVRNAGVADITGAEADIEWAPNDRFLASFSYAYSEAEYDQFPEGPCWVATPWQTGQADPGDNGDGSCDRGGDRLVGNPEHQAVITLGWQQPIGEAAVAGLRGEYVYSSNRFTALNNDPLTRDTAYDLVNLLLHLTWLPADLELSFRVRNLMDENYRSVTNDAPLQEGRLIAFYNEPRTWSVGLRKNF